MTRLRLPEIGQSIETPNGSGVVNGIVAIGNGDYELLVTNFECHTLEKLTASEWNEYIDLTGVMDFMDEITFKRPWN